MNRSLDMNPIAEMRIGLSDRPGSIASRLSGKAIGTGFRIPAIFRVIEGALPASTGGGSVIALSSAPETGVPGHLCVRGLML
jgi:hypothetical protein